MAGHSAMIILEISEPTPSLNRMLGEHWAKKVEQRRRWRWLVRAAMLQAKFFPLVPLPRARITITRYGRRMCDPDNLIGGTKMLTDSLVREGILANDTPDRLELIVRQEITKIPHTTVLIEPA